MNNLFELAHACLYRSDITEKLTLTHHAKALAESGQLDYSNTTLVESISTVVFPEKPILLPPRDMPKRKLNTVEGIAAFFHAIAHIEFVAIYLAWDIIYRFREMPIEFYVDWLKVADEEAQHFLLIQNHLNKMSISYGDLPAHSGLWDLAEQTAHDILVRLALVPRCMEAHGLDVTPSLIEKFKQRKDEDSVALLTRILEDEVGHVALGSKWFKTVCLERHFEFETTYQQLLLDYYKGGMPKPPFNRELRGVAGFSESELNWLTQQSQNLV